MTVTLPLVAVTPPTVALTVAVPALTPVISPLLFTVRTLGLLLAQLVASVVAGNIGRPVCGSVTVDRGLFGSSEHHAGPAVTLADVTSD